MNTAPSKLRCWIASAPSRFAFFRGCLSAARLHRCVTSNGTRCPIFRARARARARLREDLNLGTLVHGAASDASVAFVAVPADVLKQCFQGVDSHFASGIEVGLSDALT